LSCYLNFDHINNKVMNIKYGAYRLEPEGRSFNLYKDTGKLNKKQRPVEQTMGYGMRFETCIETIIKDKLADIGEILTLRGYIDEYRALKTELLETI